MKTLRRAPRPPGGRDFEGRSGPVLAGRPQETSRRTAEVFCDVEIANHEVPSSVAVATRLLLKLTQELELLMHRNIVLEQRLRRINPSARRGIG